MKKKGKGDEDQRAEDEERDAGGEREEVDNVPSDSDALSFRRLLASSRSSCNWLFSSKTLVRT